jgi:capsular polysaccharide biosynthesis protein
MPAITCPACHVTREPAAQVGPLVVCADCGASVWCGGPTLRVAIAADTTTLSDTDLKRLQRARRLVRSTPTPAPVLPPDTPPAVDTPVTEPEPMNLPDLELVSAKVHDAWIASKAAQGVTSRKAEDGEELIAPYEQLSEKAKDLDRGTVRAVYDAIEAATAQPVDGDAVVADAGGTDTP